MKNFLYIVAFIFVVSQNATAQIQTDKPESFFDNVRFGGGLGLSFGNNIFYASVSPSAIYDFNNKFSAGLGLSYSHLSSINKCNF